MIGFAAQRLLELEVEGQIGAVYGEKSPERLAQRNGYRDRTGHLRRMAEKALTAVVQEANVQGVSTRSVDDLVQAMCMTGVSRSQVSRLCAEIGDKVRAFLARPIEGDGPYLWLDATSVKVRQNARIVSVAVIAAVGVNSDGRREVLSMDIGPSKADRVPAQACPPRPESSFLEMGRGAHRNRKSLILQRNSNLADPNRYILRF